MKMDAQKFLKKLFGINSERSGAAVHSAPNPQHLAPFDTKGIITTVERERFGEGWISLFIKHTSLEDFQAWGTARGYVIATRLVDSGTTTNTDAFTDICILTISKNGILVADTKHHGDTYLYLSSSRLEQSGQTPWILFCSELFADAGGIVDKPPLSR